METKAYTVTTFYSTPGRPGPAVTRHVETLRDALVLLDAPMTRYIALRVVDYWDGASEHTGRWVKMAERRRNEKARYTRRGTDALRSALPTPQREV